MTKVGRNDPCPCGSGKKYKKCCMAKDEAAASALRKAQADETDSWGLSVPYVRPAPGGTTFRPRAQLTREERLQQFEQGDLDRRIEIFSRSFGPGMLDGPDALHMLTSIRQMAVGDVRRTVATDLIMFRRVAPELYQYAAGLYTLWLIEDAIDDVTSLSIRELLQWFEDHPTEDIARFLEVIALLLYHGRGEELMHTFGVVWPALQECDGVSGTDRRFLVESASGVLMEYKLGRVGEDQKTAAPAEPEGLIGDWNSEFVREAARALAGEDVAVIWPDTADADDQARALYVFTCGWVGFMRRVHGIDGSYAGLARFGLESLFELQELEAGPAPLPDRLRAVCTTLIDRGGFGVYAASSLLALLPLYVEFLQAGRLIERSEGPALLDSLRMVAMELAPALETWPNRPYARQRVERAWRDTAATADGAIDHHAAPLEDLLGEMIHAGHFPDRDLLDRIRAHGQAAVQPLIDILNDDELYWSDADSNEVWAFLHAVVLLGELRASEGVEPIWKRMLDLDNDWVEQPGEGALGQIGAPAFEPTRRYLLDAAQNVYVRARAASALVEIGRFHREMRRQVIETLVSVVDGDTPEEAVGDDELRGFVISDLADFQAEEAMPAIERAFAEDRVDPSIIGLDEVRKLMAGEPLLSKEDLEKLDSALREAYAGEL